MNISMWVRLAVAAAVWLVLAACTNVTSPPPEEPAPDPEEGSRGSGGGGTGRAAKRCWWEGTSMWRMQPATC